MKYETRITLANGGNHNPVGTKKAWKWIDECSKAYKSARLYHLVFCVDRQQGPFSCYQGYRTNKAILKDLVQRLRRKGVRCSWRACREIDEGPKQDHLHVFLCCESASVSPEQVLNLTVDGWLYQYATKSGAYVHLNPPSDPMHSCLRYMSLPQSKPEKIQDAKIWVSYLFKRRTKPDSGEIYTSSKGGGIT